MSARAADDVERARLSLHLPGPHRDASALEREAELQKRLAAVGQMAAGIAHEIRNPLASMSGSMQVLRQELRSRARPGAAVRHRAARVGSPEPDDPRLPRATRGRSRAQPAADGHGGRGARRRPVARATARTAPRAHRIDVEAPTELTTSRRSRRRCARSSGTSRPTACGRCRTAARCTLSASRLTDDGGRTAGGDDASPTKASASPPTRPRAHLPAVPRRVRQGRRARAWRSSTASSPSTAASIHVSSQVGKGTVDRDPIAGAASRRRGGAPTRGA